MACVCVMRKGVWCVRERGGEREGTGGDRERERERGGGEREGKRETGRGGVARERGRWRERERERARARERHCNATGHTRQDRAGISRNHQLASAKTISTNALARAHVHPRVIPLC